jgi:hypothetical protein
MSADECSPDDSGYLGQVNGRYVNYYERNPSRHARDISCYEHDPNAQRTTVFARPREHYTRDEPRLKHCSKKKSSPHHHNALTWRMDPAESLSDFKLIIIGTNNHSFIKCGHKTSSSQTRREKWNVEGLFLDMSCSEDERDECSKDADIERRDYEQRKTKYNYSVRKEYNLHKVNLAVGPRSCEYFTHLFQRQKRRKGTDCDSNQHSIELPVSCLEAIPVMLDYIYASQTNEQVHATVETAVSLRYLATVFGNRSLFDAVTDFIQNDLRPETAITYLLAADLYRQKKLRNVCLQICAEEFSQMKIRHLAMIPPRLMESILYSNHFNSENNYSTCSTIAAYCRCQESNIDGPTLLALTDASIMPDIYPEEALFFIKTMLSMGMNLDVDDGQTRNLYERCIGASPSIIHEVLDSFCHSPRQDANLEDMRMSTMKTRQSKMVCADYRQLPPQVKVDLLEYALAKQSNIEYESI